MDDEAFRTEEVDISAQQIILAAAHHDVPKLTELLRDGDASVNSQDPETGYTALHAAIAALAPSSGANDTNPTESEVGSAAATIHYLFENGAIWNDLDANNETPGCLALRLGLKPLYNITVDAGVRAELLLNRLDDFEQLEDAEEELGSSEITVSGESAANAPKESENANPVILINGSIAERALQAEAISSTVSAAADLSNSTYLSSNLSFNDSNLLDEDSNGVMMKWESDIMARTAKLLLPKPGLRVLNVGHGMGIVDTLFQQQAPDEHHIIEAHPAVLNQMKRAHGWLEAHKSRQVVLHEGKWQEVLPSLVEQGLQFDAIYFDTFAEDYKAFRQFFEEYVVSLLDGNGKMSFFHGLGADRQVCYDVYTQVVELDLFDAGFEVEWEKVHIPDLDSTEEWKGVKRKYWSLEEYRLPMCKFST